MFPTELTIPPDLSPDLWISLAIVATWLGAIVGLAEWLKRTTELDAELVRKVVHIGSGHVIVLAWWLQIPAWIGVSAAIVASVIAIISYRLPILPSVNGVGRKSWGTFFYALSIGVLIAIFWPLHRPQYAAIGILVMAWGDGLAALVGQRFGRHGYQVYGMKKSWEGSATMAGVSFAISAAILLAGQGNPWLCAGVAGAIALIATGLEAFSTLGLDNLTVPLASALVGFWLMQMFVA